MLDSIRWSLLLGKGDGRYMYGCNKINHASMYVTTTVSVSGEHVQETLFASIHTPFHGSKRGEYIYMVARRASACTVVLAHLCRP